MREFKVGDKVKIINRSPQKNYFIPYGKIGTVKETDRNVKILIQFKEGVFYWVNAADVELLPQSSSIHITTNGTDTYAILKEDGKVVKKSVAKCSKDDKFDFKTGVNIAVDRLFEEKPVNRGFRTEIKPIDEFVCVCGTRVVHNFSFKEFKPHLDRDFA